MHFSTRVFVHFTFAVVDRPCEHLKNSCLSNPAAAGSAGPVPAPVPVGELESGSQSGLQSCRPGPDPSMYMDPSL